MRVTVDCTLEFEIPDSAVLPLSTTIDKAHEIVDEFEKSSWSSHAVSFTLDDRYFKIDEEEKLVPLTNETPPIMGEKGIVYHCSIHDRTWWVFPEQGITGDPCPTECWVGDKISTIPGYRR